LVGQLGQRSAGSVQVTFLEVQVHADVVVVERLDVASLLRLTPLGQELLLLVGVADHLVAAGFALLDEAVILNLLHRLRLLLEDLPLLLRRLQGRLHLVPGGQLLLDFLLLPR
jgi:hypothetical protein